MLLRAPPLILKGHLSLAHSSLLKIGSLHKISHDSNPCQWWIENFTKPENFENNNVLKNFSRVSESFSYKIV